jgi:CheY-like chemotaxis protein
MSLVLIVDDQPAIRELLITWISRDGYQTVQAADAEAALDEMMGRPADVVFCDVQLPGPGEFWLAARLHERFPETAIILATGDSTAPPHQPPTGGRGLSGDAVRSRGGAQGRPDWSPVASDVHGRSSQEGRPDRCHRDLARDYSSED